MALLVTGVLVVLLGVAVLAVGTKAGAAGPTGGVARSLLLLEQTVDARSVVRRDLSARDRFLTPLVAGARRLAERLSPGGTSARLARSLDRAGNPQGWTPEGIMATKGIGLVLGVVLGILLLGPTLRGVVVALVIGAVGLYAPDLAVYNAALRRQDSAMRGLAEAMDLLTICLQAGQAFDSALGHVARTIQGPIASEFRRVLAEIQIGRSRTEAFAGMGERLPMPQVKSFVTAITQSDRMGLPIAGVVREQAASMRLARRQRAEERAQKVTVKIIFPLILCIFPALFVVIIGPGVIRIVAAFAHF